MYLLKSLCLSSSQPFSLDLLPDPCLLPALCPLSGPAHPSTLCSSCLPCQAHGAPVFATEATSLYIFVLIKASCEECKLPPASACRPLASFLTVSHQFPGTLELFFGKGCGGGGILFYFFTFFVKPFLTVFFQQIFVK